MTMILSAKKLSASEQRTANKIKLTQLIKEANKRLQQIYNAEEVTDNPSKSHTPGPGSDLGNDPVKDKTVPQSIYETKEEMITALVAKGLSQQAATAAAEAVFGPGNDPKSGSRALAQAKYDLQIRLVNKGFGLAQARTLAADVFGVNTTADWTSSTEAKNTQGGRGTITTSMPRFGELKQAPQVMHTIGHSKGVEPLTVRKTRQASVRDLASWAVCANAVEPDAKVTLDSGIRSASAVPNTWYTEDISSIMARKAELRNNKVETGNRLLSAKRKDEVPYWAIALGCE